MWVYFDVKKCQILAIVSEREGGKVGEKGGRGGREEGREGGREIGRKGKEEGRERREKERQKEGKRGRVVHMLLCNNIKCYINSTTNKQLRSV